MNLLEGTSTDKISILKDPFKSDKIKDIWFWLRIESRGPVYEAWVNFKNGDTEGKQGIKADSFTELVKKVEDFIKSL